MIFSVSSILILLIIIIDLGLILANLDCNSVNDLNETDFSDQNSNSSFAYKPVVPLSSWEKNPMFSKCGIIPGELVNNKHSHAKFFIHWLFKSHNSFKVSFRMEYIEDYSYLNYYYSIKKFTGTEIFTKISKFKNSTSNSSDFESQSEPEATLEESLEMKRALSNKRLIMSLKSINRNAIDTNASNDSNSNASNTQHSIGHELENDLIIKFDPVPLAYEDKYDMLKYMYVVCVMVVNLEEAITFTMPFMCVDIFIDKRYYKYLKLESDDHTRNEYRKHSLGILVTLAPLSLFLLMTITFLYSMKMRRKKNKAAIAAQIDSVELSTKKIMEHSPNPQLARVLIKSMKKSRADAASRRASVKSSYAIASKAKDEGKSQRSSVYSRDRRFSRYELIDDCEAMPNQADILIEELKARVDELNSKELNRHRSSSLKILVENNDSSLKESEQISNNSYDKTNEYEESYV
jgi:hypothetical protein